MYFIQLYMYIILQMYLWFICFIHRFQITSKFIIHTTWNNIIVSESKQTLDRARMFGVWAHVIINLYSTWLHSGVAVAACAWRSSMRPCLAHAHAMPTCANILVLLNHKNIREYMPLTLKQTLHANIIYDQHSNRLRYKSQEPLTF